PLVSSPPTKPQRVVRPPGIGKNVLPVTESAATECALGCRHSGGLFALTGAKLLMPVSATRVPASMMPSDCRPVGQLLGRAGGPAFERGRKEWLLTGYMHTMSGPDSLAIVAWIVPSFSLMITDDRVVERPLLQPIRMSEFGPIAIPCGVSQLSRGRSKVIWNASVAGLITATWP